MLRFLKYTLFAIWLAQLGIRTFSGTESQIHKRLGFHFNDGFINNE